MDLVAVLDAAQDRHGVLDRRLGDLDLLEAALEGLVLLEVLLELVQRRGSDGAELSSRQGGLQDVGRVHRAVAAAGADERVDLVDEEDDLAVGVGHLLDDGFEAVLELAAVLRAGDQRAHVERSDGFVSKPFGHVALHDADGEPLGDGRLAHARLADEHGVVLGAAGQDLEHAADLVVAPDHGVDLAAARRLVEVARVAVQRVVLGLGVGVLHALPAAHVFEHVEKGVFRHALALERVRDRPGAVGERHQQVLAGDVLVAQGLGLAERGVERLVQVLTHVLAGDRRAGDDWQRLERAVGERGEGVEADTELLEQRHDQAGLVLQKGFEQVSGLDALVVAALCELGGGLHGLLSLDGKLVEVHRERSEWAARRDADARAEESGWGGGSERRARRSGSATLASVIGVSRARCI